jgi:hypothetical protein
VKFKVHSRLRIRLATRRLEDVVRFACLYHAWTRTIFSFRLSYLTDHSHTQTVAKNPTKSFKIVVNLKTDVYVREENGAGPG